MANSRKYAGLPDLDEAPETYETPELTDDVSTIKTTTIPTASESGSDEDDTAESDAAINRRRLNQDQARTRFEPSLVDARGVDFSDRVGAVHRSYRTGSRRRRRRSHGADEDFEDLDEDEEETPQVRLARLRREAEELKQQLEEAEHAQDKTKDGQQNAELTDGVTALASILDGLHASVKSSQTAEQKLLRSLSTAPPTISQLTAQQPTKDDALSRTSELETPSSLVAAASLSDRLTALETVLGVTAPSTTTATPPILPTLTSLTTQITTLTTTLLPTSPTLSASPSIHLDDLTTRLRTLTLESERLTTARRAAMTAANDLANARAAAAAVNPHSHADVMTAEHKVTTATAAANAGISLSVLDDQTAKIRSLYQTLPTITSLHPILPTVLERLRSLNRVHAAAATAQGDLEELEQAQAELEKEVKRWREGLEKVEEKVKEVEGVMKGNLGLVGERLRGLEGRVAKLE